MNLKTGHLLAGGRYRVERVLGQGGFGITYEARDTKFKSRVKSVAIKEFVVKDFCNREEETNRIIVATQSKVELVEKLRNKFIDEANALFELEHPGIVRVTDTFEENNTAYYVMEYINGSSLSTIIEKDGPLSEDVTLGYMRQAAAALEYLHGQNRLHLDIKPHNIMVDNDGRVVLIDFGVSKQYDEVDNANTSTLMGYTPGYAPLEQCNNGVMEFTPTTDIYSLGAVLFKLLTGETPPHASEVNENGLPALPKVISATTCHAIETAMQPRRKDRPQSIGEFLALLDGNVKAENGKVKTESNDDGATVLLTDNKVEGVEKREKLTADDKNRPAGNSPKRPFNKRLLAIISVATICIVAAFFGIKSCNNRKAAEAEAQRATAIAEQQRIDAERKAQERADSIAAEQQCLEAEQQRQEQERLAKEAAEKKRKEEEKRKRQEAAKRSHGTINGHEWVDLGLSVKWATCNVGASKPEDYGGYYAWGETKEKSDYSWSTYKWYKGSSNTMVKYCTNGRCGTVDNKTVLEPQDDVAHVKWGGTWRMPTSDELDELRKKCKWEWTTINRVNGYKVTGPNGNSIFLPAADYRDGAVANDRGCYGGYWSSSLSSNSNYAYRLYFSNSGCDWGSLARFGGRSVRPVSKLRESYD